MSAIEPPRLIIAESTADFDRLLDDESVEIKFESQAAEEAYQEADWRLHLQICDVMGVEDGYERSDHLVWVQSDWLADRSKMFQADAIALGPDQVEALRALLQGEFADWRIVVGVFRDFATKHDCIGGLCIYATHSLVLKEVLPVIQRSRRSA
jgi:hypothetical protein